MFSLAAEKLTITVETHDNVHIVVLLRPSIHQYNGVGHDGVEIKVEPTAAKHDWR